MPIRIMEEPEPGNGVTDAKNQIRNSHHHHGPRDRNRHTEHGIGHHRYSSLGFFSSGDRFCRFVFSGRRGCGIRFCTVQKKKNIERTLFGPDSLSAFAALICHMKDSILEIVPLDQKPDCVPVLAWWAFILGPGRRRVPCRLSRLPAGRHGFAQDERSLVADRHQPLAGFALCMPRIPAQGNRRIPYRCASRKGALTRAPQDIPLPFKRRARGPREILYHEGMALLR